MAGRRRFTRKAYDEINVTSLVDTLFFLLIIFMLTAPLLENAVEVSPPVMNASKIKADGDTQTISIRKDGTIVFGKRTISADDLQRELYAIYQSKPDTAIYLRGDKEVLYGTVMEVMRTVKQAKFRNIQLITEEEPK